MKLLANCGVCGVEVQIADGKQVSSMVSVKADDSNITILCAKENPGIIICPKVNLGEFIRSKIVPFCSMACLLKFVETATAKLIVGNRLGVSTDTDTDEDAEIKASFETMGEEIFKKDRYKVALQSFSDAQRRHIEEQQKAILQKALSSPTGLLK